MHSPSRRASFRYFGCLSAALALALGGVGCDTESDDPAPVDKPSNNNTPEGHTPPDGMSSIRVVHASPDAPAVDVWVKGGEQPIVSNISFGETSAYLDVEPGEYDIELRAAPSTASDAVVYSTGAVALEEGAVANAVAAGLLSSSEPADKFRVLALFDGYSASGSGNAIVRVVHGGADAPSVGIDLHNDDPTSPEITGLDRFRDTGAEGFPLTAGEPLQIGIASGGSTVTAFTTPALAEGAELLIIATGLVGKLARQTDGFALLAVGPEGTIGFIRQNPVIYALHGSPNAPTVDAFVGDAEIFAGLSFGQLSGPVQVPPGNYQVDFYGADSKPTAPPAASADTGELMPGERYLSIATGLLGQTGSTGFQLASYAEAFDRTEPGDARLRVIHSSPDAPAVDIGILNAEQVVSPVLVGDVSFPDASEGSGFSVGVGTLPIGITPAGQNATVVASFHVTTASEVRAFGIASGALSPDNGASFRLLAVDTTPTPWTVATIHPQP